MDDVLRGDQEGTFLSPEPQSPDKSASPCSQSTAKFIGGTFCKAPKGMPVQPHSLFKKKNYWAAFLRTQSCPILSNPLDYTLPGSSVHGIFSGKNTGVGCHLLLQGIFPTQGLNSGLLHCRWILYQLSYLGSALSAPNPMANLRRSVLSYLFLFHFLFLFLAFLMLSSIKACHFLPSFAVLHVGPFKKCSIKFLYITQTVHFKSFQQKQK